MSKNPNLFELFLFTLDFFDFCQIITLDFFDFCQIITLDFFDFVFLHAKVCRPITRRHAFILIKFSVSIHGAKPERPNIDNLVTLQSKTSCFTVEGGIYFTRLDVIFEGKTTCFTFRDATPSSSNRIGFTFRPLNNKQKGDVKKLRSPL